MIDPVEHIPEDATELNPSIPVEQAAGGGMPDAGLMRSRWRNIPGAHFGRQDNDMRQ